MVEDSRVICTVTTITWLMGHSVRTKKLAFKTYSLWNSCRQGCHSCDIW